MVFTNGNTKAGDIIKTSNGQFFFVTRAEPDVVCYENLQGGRMGIIHFKVIGELITDNEEVAALIKTKEEGAKNETERWEAFRVVFDLRNDSQTREAAMEKFLELS